MAQGESRESDYGDVLLAIVERLIQQVKGCNQATCFFSLDPDDMPANAPGDHTVIVSPASGQFRGGAFAGGGRAFLAVDGGFFVKIHCPTSQDRQDQDAIAITSKSLGVIRKGTAVLAALLEPWVPVVLTSDGQYALTGSIEPLNFSIDKDASGSVRAIQLAFACPFDWDLTKI
jgi:hypothetical protein